MLAVESLAVEGGFVAYTVKQICTDQLYGDYGIFWSKVCQGL